LVDSVDPLDDLFRSSRKGLFQRKLNHRLELVREAYTVGVPALLMKSSTDRLGLAAGYSFHLGTPDEVLRRIASWLLSNSDLDRLTQLKLHDLLWKRYGREDVALAALLLANIDIDDEQRWARLSSVAGKRRSVAAESLLLSVEELFRAGRLPPPRDMLESWFDSGSVLGHLALLVSYNTYHSAIDDKMVNGEARNIPDWLNKRLQEIKLVNHDSLLVRIRNKLISDEF